MDFSAEPEEATVATVLLNLNTMVLNLLTQKNAIIKQLQEQLKEDKV